MRVFVVGVLAALIPCLAWAGPPSRQQSLLQLAKLAGVERILEQARGDSNTEARTKVQGMIGQVRNYLPELTPEQHAAFDAAAEKFLGTVASPYDTDAAVAAWGKSFGADLTDAQLAQLVELSRTPLGREQLKAATRAAAQWKDYLVDARANTLQAAYAHFMDQIRKVMGNGAPAQPADVVQPRVPAAATDAK